MMVWDWYVSSMKRYMVTMFMFRLGNGRMPMSNNESVRTCSRFEIHKAILGVGKESGIGLRDAPLRRCMRWRMI